MGDKITKYAGRLLEAEKTTTAIAPLTEEDSNFTVEDAYRVQLANIREKVKNGRVITGKKVGLTSKAMQDLLGVNEPDYGHLLDDMVVENGGTVSMSRLLQPKIEAEIAFILKEDLTGGDVSVIDVLKATDYIVPALEIVDSRIRNWKIKLADTVADNASSGLYILGGTPRKPESVDLKMMGMVLERNGELVNTGIGAAALGDPAYCVAWLANKLSEFNISLRAGEVILSGALSAAADAASGDVFTATFAHIGQVSVRFTH